MFSHAPEDRHVSGIASRTRLIRVGWRLEIFAILDTATFVRGSVYVELFKKTTEKESLFKKKFNDTHVKSNDWPYVSY